jgi:hypothetical protein
VGIPTSGTTLRSVSCRRLAGSTNLEKAMSERGELLYFNEAMEFIKGIQNPVTRNFLNMAVAHLIKSYHVEKQEFPRCDFDMLYFVRVLAGYYSRHDIIARTLAGERVGAFWEDDT